MRLRRLSVLPFLWFLALGRGERSWQAADREREVGFY